MTDPELIEASRHGDREAYGALVERCQRMVEAVAYGAAGDPAIVDDVVQDTFVAAWQQLDRLRDEARLRPWLCGIAMNIARKMRRRRRATVAVDVAGGDTPFETMAARERTREVAKALAGLSPRYREPLVLFYYEHCTIKEVAAALAIREDAAMQRLSRGRQQLGTALAARVEETLDRRPSRKTIVVAVLALLPLVRSRSAAAAVIGTIAPRVRLVAAVLAVAAIGVVVLHAVNTSERVAAARAAHSDDNAARPAHADAPHLPERQATAPAPVHRNIVVASNDPVETCRRGVHGLVSAALGKHQFVLVGDQTSDGPAEYRPDPVVEHIADELGETIGETCAAPWPELYVICEGTTTDMLDGTVTCYPYDPFE